MIQTVGVVLHRHGELPVLEPLTIHDIGDAEVLVEMRTSGICHTDLSYLRDARTLPVLLGHEGAGVVRDVGKNVSHVQPGDHVVINWQAKCNHCTNCLRGRQDLCENIQGTASPKVFYKNQPLSVMLNAGTFCPFVVVPASGAVPIRKDLPFDKAAMLGCAVATGVGAALYTANVQPGETVVVVGCGGVGLNVIQGAGLAQAGTIIAIDPSHERLQLAQKYGATHVLESNENIISQVRDLTYGRGVDHAFEVVGHSELMLQCLDMLARGGTLTLVGAAARDATLPFFPRRFMSQQQKIQGCIYGNIRPLLDFPLFANWYMEGKLLLDDLRGSDVSLGDVPKVFSGDLKPSGVRPIVTFKAEAS
jgi:S-(hydroxymethyl)glutathione dehydrogenase / alcohol dehydrogenase